ncbi:ImmA/IrrE family metallo-endopeptidase [Candidatus Corynebacterium faecigallinarum]|uniref:ImmA/IrrE family metallo-endopeptidase n=1 Tax=Candidatus Corynebacterium faecigallinarum TaxID=2838528 RepID=UPI003FD61900
MGCPRVRRGGKLSPRTSWLTAAQRKEAPLTITNPDLARLAERLGVRLVRHDGGPKGYYRHSTQTISTRRGLSIAEYRSTLAHELGHAAYGDELTGNGHYDQRQERRADRYAAMLLIDPDDLDSWCRFYGPSNLPSIAHELEVTTHILATWRDLRDKDLHADLKLRLGL